MTWERNHSLKIFAPSTGPNHRTSTIVPLVGRMEFGFWNSASVEQIHLIMEPRPAASRTPCGTLLLIDAHSLPGIEAKALQLHAELAGAHPHLAIYALSRRFLWISNHYNVVLMISCISSCIDLLVRISMTCTGSTLISLR